jgi:hypothetical protein
MSLSRRANAPSTSSTEPRGNQIVGVDYTSGGFFGTFAKDGSAAADVLGKLYRDAEGDPTFDAVPNITLSQHGNAYSGEHAYSIQQRGEVSFTTRAGGHSAPMTLTDARPEAIRESIAALGLNESDFEPIGFYLYLDVW